MGSREGLERGRQDTCFAFTCCPHLTHAEVTGDQLFLIRDLLQISKRGAVTGGAGTWAAYVCRLRWRDRPRWLVPRGHCTWIVKHQTAWAEDPGSLVLMSKTHEVCSLQNEFNSKNRIGGRMRDAIINHQRGARSARQVAAETVPCQGTPRGGHIALGWCGAGQGTCWDGLRTEAGRGGHLFSLGGGPRPYSTVHTPSTVGR